MQLGLPERPGPSGLTAREARPDPVLPAVRRQLDRGHRSTRRAHGPTANLHSSRRDDLLRGRLHDHGIERNARQGDAGGDIARVARVDLSLHAIGFGLEIVGGGFLQQRNAAEPFDASSANPARHHRAERETVHRREWCSVELTRQNHTQCLGQVDRAPEAEPLTLALYLIQADELDVPRAPVHPHGLENLAQGNAGPAARADRLRSPGQLARQGTQGQELLPAQPGAHQRGRRLLLRKVSTQLLQREPSRTLHQSADFESPCPGIYLGNRGVTAGEEPVERSDEVVRLDRPGAGVESVGIPDYSMGSCQIIPVEASPRRLASGV